MNRSKVINIHLSHNFKQYTHRYTIHIFVVSSANLSERIVNNVNIKSIMLKDYNFLNSRNNGFLYFRLSNFL